MVRPTDILTRRLAAAFVPAVALIGVASLALSSWWLVADAMHANPALAAKVGAVRGALWLDAGRSALEEPNASREQVEAGFRRSLELSPMNSSAWFGLASATERLDWLNQTSSKALKMSYYTGFNVRQLIAGRLALLAQIDSTRDPELGDLLRRQIHLILTRAPELKSALAPAYRTASGANRQIFEDEFLELHERLPE